VVCGVKMTRNKIGQKTAIPLKACGKRPTDFALVFKKKRPLGLPLGPPPVRCPLGVGYNVDRAVGVNPGFSLRERMRMRLVLGAWRLEALPHSTKRVCM
jgi:hypothetical protein